MSKIYSDYKLPEWRICTLTDFEKDTVSVKGSRFLKQRKHRIEKNSK